MGGGVIDPLGGGAAGNRMRSAGREGVSTAMSAAFPAISLHQQGAPDESRDDMSWCIARWRHRAASRANDVNGAAMTQQAKVSANRRRPDRRADRIEG